MVETNDLSRIWMRWSSHHCINWMATGCEIWTSKVHQFKWRLFNRGAVYNECFFFNSVTILTARASSYQIMGSSTATFPKGRRDLISTFPLAFSSGSTSYFILWPFSKCASIKKIVNRSVEIKRMVSFSREWIIKNQKNCHIIHPRGIKLRWGWKCFNFTGSQYLHVSLS